MSNPKKLFCYQCQAPIRLIRDKENGKWVRADKDNCFFVPGPKDEGQQFVTPDGIIRWGHRAGDGRFGYMVHVCPYAKNRTA